jgi:hypothetical protein
MGSWREPDVEAELEQLLEQADEAVYEELRGRAVRHRAQRFASHLRRQGFLPTPHFPQRFLQRVVSRGIRFDSCTFRREFYRSRHYRRPGSPMRIAVVHGVPVLYRMAAEGDHLIALVGVLPEGAPPRVVPTPTPLQGKVEEMFRRPRRPPGARTGGAGGSPPPPRDLTRAQMASFLHGIWNRNPILQRLARAQTITGQARHRELIHILEEFQRRTGITIQVVPQGTVQAARGAGNLASLRSRPGFLQIEQQVFRNTDTLMDEVRHELSYHYAGGPGGVPRLRNTPFNALNLLEMMIQEHGRLPPPVA